MSSLSNRNLFSLEQELQEQKGINGMKKQYARKGQRNRLSEDAVVQHAEEEKELLKQKETFVLSKLRPK